MYAAKEGRSTLGIPPSVGREFVGDEAPTGHAAGVVIVAPDGDILLLRRSTEEKNFGGHWGLPGGGANDGESPEDCANRETCEEIGAEPGGPPLKLLNRVKTPTGLLFHTFAQPAPRKFVPKLNDEHIGFQWASLDALPSPLHPAVAETLGPHIGVTQDMKPEEWQTLRESFAKWTREEQAEPEHAQDSDSLAFDKASVRTTDRDGRMHVAVTNISKAAVNPYVGKEIPDWEKLGLDPGKIYYLLRDPEELAKAAPTFNNLPLLSEHVPVTAEDHQPDLVIGSTGTDAEFVAPFLRNSLVLWAKHGIDAVESESQKELSSAYRYTADMTPGNFAGTAYDGVMRNIIGNHVALVKEGRAGADVVVGDSNQEIAAMAKKPIVLTPSGRHLLRGVVAFLKPIIAKDAKLDMALLAPGLDGLTSKNFKDKKPKIVEGVTALTKGKLAQDASLDALPALLDAFGEKPLPEAKDDPGMLDTSGFEDDAMDDEGEAGMVDKIKTMLEAAGVDPAIIAKCDEVAGAEASATDAGGPPMFEGKPDPDGKMKAAHDAKVAKDEADKKAAKEEEDKKMVDKPAMDAAIAAATKATEERVLKNQRALRDAEKAVHPYVGELAVACDSAEQVYKHALDILKVDTEGVPPAAFPALLKMVPKPGEKRVVTENIGMDAAHAKNFATRFPNANRIGHA